MSILSTTLTSPQIPWTGLDVYLSDQDPGPNPPVVSRYETDKLEVGEPGVSWVHEGSCVDPFSDGIY